jgi:hypothetical protein
MGDDHDGQAEGVPQLEQQGQDLAAHRRIKRRHRLVGEEDIRLERQGPGDDHPLALATRQLVGVAQEKALGRTQTGLGEGGRHQLGLVPGDSMDPNPLRDRLVHAVARVQCPGRVLQHQLDPTPVSAQCATCGGQRSALELNRSGAHRDQTQ